MAGNEVRGRFLWYELLTMDPEAATGFYTRVIGWGTTQWEGGEAAVRGTPRRGRRSSSG